MDTTGYNLKYDFNYAGRRLIVWIRDSESCPLIDFISLSQTVFGFEEEDYAFRRLEPLVEHAGKVQNKMVVDEEGMKLFLEEHMTATFMDKLLKQFNKWFEALKRILPGPVRKEICMEEKYIVVGASLVKTIKDKDGTWYNAKAAAKAAGIDEGIDMVSANNIKKPDGNDEFVNNTGLLEMLVSSKKSHIAKDIVDEFINGRTFAQPVQITDTSTAEKQEEPVKVTTVNSEEAVKVEEPSSIFIDNILVRDTIIIKRTRKINVIVISKDNTDLQPWYNIEQVCRACDLTKAQTEEVLSSIDKKDHPYTEEGQLFVSYSIINSIISGLAKDGAHKVQEIVAATKSSLSEGQALLDRSIVPGEGMESFTLGAIVLAEAFREALEIAKWKEIKTKKRPGTPGNSEILRRLWVHIEAAGLDDNEPSFEFKKTYVLARERYNRLMLTIEKMRG